MRQRYQATRDFIVAELAARLAPHATVETPLGGMHVIANLAPGLDDRAVAQEALRRDVVVRPLSPLYIRATPRHGLDIGFTGFEHAEMAAAAERLGQALAHVAGARRATPARGAGYRRK